MQRRTLPEALPFYDLEDELEQLADESANLVTVLQKLPTTSLAEVIAKLEVVVRMIEPDDYPDAHVLLVGTMADLKVTARRQA